MGCLDIRKLDLSLNDIGDTGPSCHVAPHAKSTALFCRCRTTGQKRAIVALVARLREVSKCARSLRQLRELVGTPREATHWLQRKPT